MAKLLHRISCNAEAPAFGRPEESWGMQYNAEDWIVVRTKERLNRRQRIGEVKASDGTQMWLEADGDPVLFDVKGVTPVSDGFGKILEFMVYAERVDNR